MLRLTVLLAALSIASCGSQPAPPRPDVVILMLDTTRVDHLGAYGGRAPTPFLDRLARESVVFENAWAASTCTAPSIASMFTGLVPPRHGLEANILAQPGPKGENETVLEFLSSVDLIALPTAVPTLTELLVDAGYQALGVGSNPNFCRALGFSRGFEHFSEHSHRDAEAVVAEWRKLARELDPARPTFTYLHFMDPHAPYQQRAPWCPHTSPAGCAPLCRYRSEVAYLDAQLAALFDEAGWLAEEDTVVILVTDHGEEFLDHGNVMHRFSVYQELARAGLFLRAPGFAPGRSAFPAHHTDLLPTLLALLDLQPREALDGLALLPEVLIGGGGGERPLLTVRLSPGDGRALWGLTLGDWRLLEEQPSGAAQLYDIAQDPTEQRDLADEEPEVLAELTRKLAELRAELEPVPFERVTIDLTESMQEVLLHLGYVGDGE